MLKTKKMQNTRFKRPRQYKKYVLCLIFVLLVSGGILFALEKTGVTNFYSTNKNNPQNDGETIKYDPPTEDEKQAGDLQKDRILEEEDSRANPAENPSQNAHVIITDAGQYDNTIEVRAFIPDFYQDGTCTITFTKESLRVSKDTPAYRDASTTICTNPNFDRSEFQISGDWQVTVIYNSSNARGSSDTQTVTIK